MAAGVVLTAGLVAGGKAGTLGGSAAGEGDTAGGLAAATAAGTASVRCMLLGDDRKAVGSMQVQMQAEGRWCACRHEGRQSSTGMHNSVRAQTRLRQAALPQATVRAQLPPQWALHVLS